MLEESWFELFVFTAAQWNFPVDEFQLIPSHMPVDRREASMSEIRRFKDFLSRCNCLGIDHLEYACLKAIVLYKGGRKLVIL